MLYPFIETTNPPAAVAELSAALSHQAADSLKESAVAVSARVREEERASPICAAYWAY